MDLVGATIGDSFRVLKELQSGYFGQTWLAVHKGSENQVCLKTFHSTHSESLYKELMILKQMVDGHFDHENLCKVLDISINKTRVSSSSGQPMNPIHYVVFEYCSGSDLFNYLCTGPWEKHGRVSSFSESIGRHYFRQLLLGLTYLHERGVFHRDIKPENCVIDGNLNLKLTDFGTNKVFQDSNPSQVLRTRTRGIGTESYRAPEVNSGIDYDPSSADIWSVGVTLFFLVGIEHMWKLAQSLDPHMKQVVAPLGIFFPFPMHCSKLDSYLKRQVDLQKYGVTGSLKGMSLPNDKFWTEWCSFNAVVSPELKDLLNRIFVMEPKARLSLRDVLRHSWMNIMDGLSPEAIQQDMVQRCPSSIQVSADAHPKVIGSKLLGGLDQAVLRDTLSGSKRDELDFPEDSEVWSWSKSLLHLESIQMMLAYGDLQELVIDIGFSCSLLLDILKNPREDKYRTIQNDQIPSEWIVQLLLVIGFLPQGHSFYLSDDNLDLMLLNAAITLLQGMESGILRSAVMTVNIDDNNKETKDEDGEIMEMEIENDGNNNYQVQDSVHWPSVDIPDGGDQYGCEPLPSHESTDVHLPSSQDSSVWASMSSQSSQEELPESLQFLHDWHADFDNVHKLITLNAVIDSTHPKQFNGASMFCKLSGLLCSYGLYQVVCHNQLLLYARGDSSSFSVRLVQQPNNETGQCLACISTWCFCGMDEWHIIFERLCNDLTN